MEDPQGLDVGDYQGSENPQDGVLMVKHTVGLLPRPSPLVHAERDAAWGEFDLALQLDPGQMAFDFMR